MSKIEDQVCEKLQSRAAAGKRKYGVTMERGDLTRAQWLQHAQEEALDLAVYLEKLLEEQRTIGSVVSTANPPAAAVTRSMTYPAECKLVVIDNHGVPLNFGESWWYFETKEQMLEELQLQSGYYPDADVVAFVRR